MSLVDPSATGAQKMLMFRPLHIMLVVEHRWMDLLVILRHFVASIIVRPLDGWDMTWQRNM